jgi:ribosome-dependent ATPase
MTDPAQPVARIEGLIHQYGARRALDAITIDIPGGCRVGLIGPDGVGKSSLLAILAGARRIQLGRVEVLGLDFANQWSRRAVCARIAYLPQGLGKNLYPDLSVWENIDFFGRLFGHSHEERRRRIIELLDSTGLAPFPDRAARKLSGGMRQKLGLCCALIHDPDFLILDEPTTGVDPLSRRQFWDLIDRIRIRRSGMSVIVATAYMEEAERFDWLIAMDDGRVVATGTPAELKARTGTTTIEDAFVALARGPRAPATRHVPARRPDDRETVIVARDLTRRFGDFTAVDRVSFSIERGEIFGFLGSNGCGKTTTMKMLTGLLTPTSGEALLFGAPLHAADIRSRARVGYMSQSFSLYTELTVAQNLDLHGRLFRLPRADAHDRIADLIERFGLGAYADQLTADLPLGIRQRLSLAVAIVHRPEMLILDEPTSGVDPVARDEFWNLLVDLARNENVTIFVSTHFMNEAARCDRISLMDGGRVLATGAPENLMRSRGAATLEETFISYLEEASARKSSPSLGRIKDSQPFNWRQGAPSPPLGGEGREVTGERAESFTRFLADGTFADHGSSAEARLSQAPMPRPQVRSFSPGRIWAYSRRETLELLRDPIRMAFAFLGTAFLMIIFGFGITTDVDTLAFATLDRDQTPESRAYLAEVRGSRYFIEKAPAADYAELDRRMRNGEINASIEIPPGFGRDIKRGRPTAVGVVIDGAMPFRAQTIRGYLQGLHQQYLSDPVISATGPRPPDPSAVIETRFRYNQDFDSVYAMVPSTMAMLLVMIPAILMAVAIVREKELGSIINLYVTPVTRIEFLVGKQLPYVAVAMGNFVALLLMALFLFEVPLKGSLATLALGALIYVTATTGYGMLISAFTGTQIAALVAAAVATSVPAVQFSGMLTPVSSLTGAAAVIGQGFPMTYFLRICVGTLTKGLGFSDLGASLLALAVFVPVFTLISLAFLRKQAR